MQAHADLEEAIAKEKAETQKEQQQVVLCVCVHAGLREDRWREGERGSGRFLNEGQVQRPVYFYFEHQISDCDVLSLPLSIPSIISH